MHHQSAKIEALIEAFTQLPGIGRKSAQRMTYALLERNREGGLKLAHALEEAVTQVGHCQQCRTFSEEEQCALCRSSKRANGQLCVVEMPQDILAIEQAGVYQGRYFVLMGHLSPIDGLGPEALGLDLLEKRLQEEAIEELILATNPTVEGEATANFIENRVKKLSMTPIVVTKLAQGIPMGGELEYLDSTTLIQAFSYRHRSTIESA